MNINYTLPLVIFAMYLEAVVVLGNEVVNVGETIGLGYTIILN